MTTVEQIGYRGRLIIHVGPHKTGSTSLQKFLAANYESLRRAGVLYPRSGRMRDGAAMHFHHPLMLSLLGEKDGDPKGHLAALRGEIDDAEPNVVILSSEVLSREYISSEIYTCLKHVFPSADAAWCIFVRRQDDLVASRYAEGIKRGSIQWPNGIALVNVAPYLDHRLRLEKLRYAVSDDPLVVVPFDKVKQDLVTEFFRYCSVEVGIATELHNRENRSHPWGVLHALRVANALPRGLGGFCRRGALFLGRRLAGTRLRFLVDWGHPVTTRERADIMARYRETNRWVEMTYFDGEHVLTEAPQGELRARDAGADIASAPAREGV